VAPLGPAVAEALAMFRALASLTILPFLLVHSVRADEPSLVHEPAIKVAERNHWAFQPPKCSQPPMVCDAGWVRTPIDAFILSKLEEKGLKPAAEADRLTLLRRVMFDLIGLPPTSQEQLDFVADSRPDAYERVVERLLQSPHYGERWAMHWLDVVRYAESNGYEADGERPHAWRYRDYVVRSFNDDKRYDRFLIEQVAGDLLPNSTAEQWTATGLHRCGPVHMVGGNSDAEANRQEVLTEMVNGLGAAFLGLTVGCARCHDHKFDPISQADYYRMQAFFSGTQFRDRDLATAEEKAAHDKQVEEIKKKTAPLQAKIAALEAPYRTKLSAMKKAALESKYGDALAVSADKRTPEQKKLAEHAEILLKLTWDEILAALSPEERAQRRRWRDELHALEANLPQPTAQVWSVGETETIPPTHLLRRGDVKKKDAVVFPAYPRVLTTNLPNAADKHPNRLDLASWLTRADHPLTARVWVNRVWQHHFGRGLVATPNDFGLRGARPTHPELLDWLAVELAERGWSTKHLHRLMVLSSTYRQASRAEPGADPENIWLARMNRKRLEAEALRDAVLAAAGSLNEQIGGPMVRVPLEPEVYDLIFTEGEPDGMWKPTPDRRQHSRRTIYLFAKRNVRQPLLEAFDQPDSLNACPERAVSTFAPQALILMNGPLAQAQSHEMALRLLREVGSDDRALVERAWRLALARPPLSDEARTAVSFLNAQTALLRSRPAGLRYADIAGVEPARVAAVVDLCLGVVNLNEFVYIE
jgi:hypothetical protein